MIASAGVSVKRMQQRRGSGAQADGKGGALEKYARELVVDAERGRLDPVIGREDEIRRVIEILSRRSKNNPCLVGDPGVGKTAIVEGLAQRILAGDVPHNLNGTSVWSLDLASLYAGTKFRGELEERFKQVMKEVEDAEGKVLLFIDEIHMLIGGSSEGELANLLKPALARGLRCIGATTLNEYRQYIEKDGAFERRFQRVMANEPSVEDTISILRGLRERYGPLVTRARAPVGVGRAQGHHHHPLFCLSGLSHSHRSVRTAQDGQASAGRLQDLSHLLCSWQHARALLAPRTHTHTSSLCERLETHTNAWVLS